jgi:protein-tyrosine phosphatase
MTSEPRPTDPNAATTPEQPRSILFVCLGNICRSPLAEGVFRHRAEERGVAHGLHIDSAGTGSWHVGAPADARARETAERRGIRLESRGRQVTPEDATRFDLILAMDRSNLRDLETLFASVPGRRAELRLFRDFDPEAGGAADVPDPYYGGDDGFEKVHEMVERTCAALLDERFGEGVPHLP